MQAPTRMFITHTHTHTHTPTLLTHTLSVGEGVSFHPRTVPQAGRVGVATSKGQKVH